MASRPPGPAGMPATGGMPPAGPTGGGRLMAGAAPGAPPPPGASVGPNPGAASSGAAPNPEAVMQGIGQMASMIESSLTAFAQAMPEGASEFDQANELIKAGVAKAIQAQGLAPSLGAPPSSSGRGFPGGGMTGSSGGAGVR